MTATLFNQSYRHTAAAAAQSTRAPPAVKRIVIVGGGTAGWMTAMILAHALIGRGVSITLLESPTVDIIGVGEGSTPWLRGFFDGLDIEESEWMPACNATYKCGIRFDGWSTKPGFESYFHPFASMLDNLTMTQFIHNATARVNGADVDAHPDRFFIATRLAQSNLAPIPAESFPFDVWYGYHFDAVLLGKYLHRKAVERGVEYHVCHVTHANLDERGDIASVSTREGDTITADFFVDCTGFASLLIGKALGTKFVSFSENLFNDAAVAMPTPNEGPIPPQTVATALKHGWMWKIPLTSRYGNGYVYSSAFCSASEAEHELRHTLGLLDADIPARHLKMRVGRMTKHWNRNCLAVGLAQGFIEPLEATALLFIQKTAAGIVEYLDSGDFSEAAHDRYNRRVNEHFEGTRDYIVTHYKTNSRSDTEYWRANAANLNLSDALKRLLSRWMSGNNIVGELSALGSASAYPVFSWYCILAGTGIFPDAHTLHPANAREQQYSLAEIGNLLSRSAMNFRDHRTLLESIPPRREEESLQIYFW